MAMHLAVNQAGKPIGGSSPSPRANGAVAQLVEHLVVSQKDAGSSPVSAANMPGDTRVHPRAGAMGM